MGFFLFYKLFRCGAVNGAAFAGAKEDAPLCGWLSGRAGLFRFIDRGGQGRNDCRGDCFR
jgi:hypothetical protein